jgi:hypothetical protein
MNQDAEHLRLLSIFHYAVAGVAGFCSLFSAALHGTGICLRRVISPSTNESDPGGPAGPAGMGVRRSWNFSFPAWRSVCRRSGPCRSIAFPSKGLLVRIGRCLYRVHLCPLRDDSWSIHDYRVLAPISEDVVLIRNGVSPNVELTSEATRSQPTLSMV